MRKINYPYLNKEEKIKFLNAYFDSIVNKIEKQTELCNEIRKIDNSWSLKKMITADFNELVNFAKEIDSKNINALNSFFKFEDKKNEYLYTELQRKIADFLIEKKLNFKTCYYCNIDFINPFNQFVPYSKLEDFFNNATELEWIELISEKRGKLIYKYIKSNKNCTIFDLQKSIPKIGKLTINKIKISEINKLKKYRDHFTLDHILPKSKYPYLSISLFNLIPSCYSCNSKFKSTREFNRLDFLNKISPSSETFDLDKSLKFRLNFNINEGNFAEKIKKIEEIDDIKVVLTNVKSENEVDTFIDMFALKGRYDFHKNISYDLIKKRKNYSDSQIKEIAQLTKRDILDVKKDLFSSLIFENENTNEPFEKYKKDIAIQLGII